jgi:hypothetical protein
MFGRHKSIDSPLELDTASVISSVFGPDEQEGFNPDDGVISQVSNGAVNHSIDVTVHTPHPQPQPNAYDAWPRNLPAHLVSLPAMTDPEQTDGSDIGSSDEANSSAAETPLVRLLSVVSLPAMTDPEQSDGSSDEASISAETPLARLLRCESDSSGSLPTRTHKPRLIFGRDFGSMHETPQIAGGMDVASRFAGSFDVGTLSDASVDSGDGGTVGVEAGVSDADLSQLVSRLGKNGSLCEDGADLFVGTERYMVVPGTTLADIRQLYALHELFLM